MSTSPIKPIFTVFISLQILQINFAKIAMKLPPLSIFTYIK